MALALLDSRDDDWTYPRMRGHLAEVRRVVDQTRAMIETSRDLLERSQRFLRRSADPRRTDQARQVVQQYIDDQKALIRMLRREH